MVPESSAVALSDERAPDRPSGREWIEPPRWLVAAALVAGGSVLSFGFVGLLLAVNDTYRAALAIPIGAAALVALVALAWPAMSGPPVTIRGAHVAALAGVAAIILITLWNGANASQHVLVDRDGGVYAEVGRWIARSGSIDFAPHAGPFANSPTPFFFAHLLPALLAQAYSVGGSDLLYHLPPLLGGVALLQFFVLAWRVLRRPVFAVAATLTLGLIIPQVAFTRDAYSELPTQVLLFAALGLLTDRRGIPHWRITLVAGLFFGATQATRIDATVFLVGIPALFALYWVQAAGTARRRALLAPTGAFVIGLVPGLVLGFVDLMHHSGTYWDDLWHDERKLVYLATASTVGCVLLALSRRRLLPFVRVLPRNIISWAAAAIVLIAALGAWFVRPHLQINDQGALTRFQVGGRAVVQATRLDFERSMIWMSWYLGPLTLMAAIIAAALLARALVRGRMLHVVAPLLVLLPGSLLYLWSASVQPDHIWVTRRFLVSAFPMLILLAFGLCDHLWTADLTARWRSAGRATAVVVAVVAVAFPVWLLIPVRSMKEQVGYLSVVQDACNTMGERPAVLVVQEFPLIPTDVYEDWTLPAFRAWCGAEVEYSPFRSTDGAAIRRLAREWKRYGRRFFVVALNAAAIRELVPEARITPTRRVTDANLLEQSVTHVPRRYQTESFSLAVAEIASR